MIKYFFLFTFLAAITFFVIGYRGIDALKGISTGIPEVKTCTDSSDCTINVSEGVVNYGVYDPGNAWVDLDTMAFDHNYVQFNTLKENEVKEYIEQSELKSRWLMLTVEPFVDQNNRSTLLSDISDGVYDQSISKICKELSYSKTPVFVRFAHEMEKVTGRYPWATNDYNAYIYAYRHFVTQCKNEYTNGFYVWSPVGDDGLDNYYPGAEYVDYIGVSVYSLPDFDIDYYGKERSFEENFGEKYNRVKEFGKPVIIAELGVSGSESKQAIWMKDMSESTFKFPQLKTVVYFNSKDNVGAWDEKYGVPDWTLSKSVF